MGGEARTMLGGGWAWPGPLWMVAGGGGHGRDHAGRWGCGQDHNRQGSGQGHTVRWVRCLDHSGRWEWGAQPELRWAVQSQDNLCPGKGQRQLLQATL